MSEAAAAAAAATPAAGAAASPQQQNAQREAQGGAAAAQEEKKNSSQMSVEEKEELSAPELQMELHRLDREKLVVSNKILELQQDLSEHRVVLEAFQNVEKTRSCFRLVGGVLVQRTVAEVQPVLETHKKKVETALQALERELEALTKRQTEYSRRYLQSTGQALQSARASGRCGGSNKDSGDEAEQHKRTAGGAGVLV